MTSWLELKVHSSHDAVDVVSEILTRYGATGTVIKDRVDIAELVDKNADLIFEKIDDSFPATGANVIGYFANSCESEQLKNDITKDLRQLQIFGILEDFSLTTELVDENDWTHQWEDNYHTQSVTRFLQIIPEWEQTSETTSDRKNIILNPGAAFGTGRHETTRLALQALEICMRAGESVIDVGTGSGVLAIAAAKLGARQVNAYDLDEDAIASAEQNIALNQLEVPINTSVNDLLHGVDEHADIIIANIVADVLLEMIADAKALLNENGHLILSGIYAKRQVDIISCLQENDLQVDTILQEKDWLAIIAS